MELLALVLLIPNTANFRHVRTSRLKVRTNRVWTILCLLRVRSLGGNLELRRVTDGFTPFLYSITMKLKRGIFLFLCAFLCFIGFAQTYTLDIGVPKFLKVPDPPMDGYIHSGAWSCDRSEICFVEKYDYGAIIQIESYFSGTATVQCRYVYMYYLNDRSHVGTGIVTYSIKCSVVPPTSVSLPAAKTIHLDETLTLTPTLTPSNAATTYRWKSSNTAVATVSSSGVVTPKDFGETAITVTTDNNLSATCIVTVEKIEATGVSIQHPGSIAVGDTKLLQCSLTPRNANSTVTWSSDNKEIATITSTGYLRAYKKGTVNITVTTDNDISATRQIRIYPAPEAISLPNEYTLGLRHTIKLAPTLYPADAYTTYTWTSDNWDVAEVDEEGIVKAISLGVANITAISKNGLSATCTVNIPYPTPQLYVWMRNGECMTFGFEEKPTLSFTTDNVSISTKSTTIEYLNNEIHKYLIVDAAVKNENSSVTPLVESMDMLEIKQEMVKISGSAPRSAVQVYTILGNIINDYCMDDEGCVMFSTSTYPL